jgi:hypothetical protein
MRAAVIEGTKASAVREMFGESIGPQFGERLYSVKELAALFGWGYDSARRYFRNVAGVLRKPSLNPYTTRRTRILVPESVVRREWQRLTSPVPPPAVGTRRYVSVLNQRKLTADQWAAIERLLREGEPVPKVAKAFGVTRQAIYKHLSRGERTG